MHPELGTPGYQGPQNPQAELAAAAAANRPWYKKKWPWIVAVVALCAIIVAAVVGGVVGSRNANRECVYIHTPSDFKLENTLINHHCLV